MLAGLERQVSPEDRAEADFVGCGRGGWPWLEKRQRVQRAGGGKPRCNWNLGWGCSDFLFAAFGVGWRVCRQLCAAFLSPAQDSAVRVAALLPPGTGPLRAGIGSPLSPPPPEAAGLELGHCPPSTHGTRLICVGLASVHCLGACFHTNSYG